MKTKSVNHIVLTGRLTENASSSKKDTYARFGIAHNVGPEPFFLNCVFFANKGRKNEREIPWDKLTKGNMLLLEGSLKPNVYVNQDTGEQRRSLEFLVNKISEPEIVEDNVPDDDNDEE